MRKMVQPSRWFLQLILLCQLWQLGFACPRGLEHSSLGVYKSQITVEEGISKAVFFLVIVGIDKLGKRLDKGYICPVYCAINHKHRYEKEKSNIQRNDGLSRPGRTGSGEQSKSNIRSFSSTRRFCRNGEKVP